MHGYKHNLKNLPSKDILQSMPDEIAQIKMIALKMLEKMDAEINDPAYSEAEKKICDRVFGSKTSLAEALVLLADLLLRLTLPDIDAKQGEKPLAMSEADRKLVGALIERSRQQHGKPRP